MSHETDLLFLRESLLDLREYILSADLYWKLKPVSNSLMLPQLTIGNLLLSQARLNSIELTSQQQADFEMISQQIDVFRTEWLSNWRIKAGREFGSRLQLWQQYLRELRGDVRQHAGYFSNEIRLRVILSLLQTGGQANISAQEEDQLAMLDQILRGISRSGPFVWAPEVEGAFSKEQYWFLYVDFGDLKNKQ